MFYCVKLNVNFVNPDLSCSSPKRDKERWTSRKTKVNLTFIRFSTKKGEWQVGSPPKSGVYYSHLLLLETYFSQRIWRSRRKLGKGTRRIIGIGESKSTKVNGNRGTVWGSCPKEILTQRPQQEHWTSTILCVSRHDITVITVLLGSMVSTGETRVYLDYRVPS